MARLFNTSFFGSNTWNFGSKIVNQLCRSWNSNIRVAYELPWNTHCWIVEELTGGRHCRQMLFSRFLKFINSLLKNRRPFLRSLCKHVCKDIRTVTASNIATLISSKLTVCLTFVFLSSGQVIFNSTLEPTDLLLTCKNIYSASNIASFLVSNLLKVQSLINLSLIHI